MKTENQNKINQKQSKQDILQRFKKNCSRFIDKIDEINLTAQFESYLKVDDVPKDQVSELWDDNQSLHQKISNGDCLEKLAKI